MRTIRQLLYLSVLTIFISTLTLATDYYVDKNASGQNNGTSWTNAWESFSSINWSSVDPGDVIYVSGGTDSTVYYQNLNIRDDGSPGNFITIRNSYDAGHNGRVIIDGQFSRTGLISTANSSSNTSSYIYIRGFEVRNGGSNEPAIQVYYGCSYITFDSLLVYNNLQRGFRLVASTWGQNLHHITIKNTAVITPLDQASQTDGIYMDMINDVWIDNSFVWARNYSMVNNHSDGLQSYRARGVKITNSVFVCDSNAQGMAMILGAESETATSDSVILYNNIIINRGIWWSGNPPDVATFNTRWYSNGYMPLTYVIHNTIISYGPDAEGIRIYYPIENFSNNILAQYGSGSNSGGDGYKYTLGSSYDQDVSAFSGENLYFREWSSSISLQGGSNWNPSVSGWSGFVTAGAGGFIDDPEFTHNWYGIPAYQFTGDVGVNSPARNQGENLQSLIESMGLQWTDRYGTPRDNTPTLGSFEYVDGPDLTPPTVVGASLQDSVTLVVNFSESLDAATAEDENNYSISNNINVFNASLSGSQVTLQTSTHSPDSYVVTVVNVEDLAGNPIAQNNTANYEYIYIPPDSIIMFTVQNVEGVIQEPDHTPIKTIDGLGALDGDPDSRWAAEPMPEELIFDLGAIRMVSKTRLSFYNWNSGRVYNYSISVSNDHNNWNTIVPQSTSASNEEWTIDEFSLVGARYVRVNFINNNQSDWAGLWEGEIWGIEGEENNPPNQPSNPSPSNGVTNQQIDLNLSWSCNDPDGDPLTYDVYFGTNSNPPLASFDQYDSSFDPGQLDNITIYYWRIVAKDNQGSSTSGPVWNFTTEVAVGDTTPPELVNAILINTTTLELIFTEPVDSVSALYFSNYTISNDINIQDVLISNYNDVVTLITDNHINGITYTVTANNIYDPSGNLISEQHNSMDYTCITDSVAPELTDVRFQNNKTLTVNFSERVDYNSASNKNNYSISDNIIINSVQVLPDSSGAMLKTSRQSNNSEYLISVSNIKDRAGNNLNPNPSSKSYRTRKKGKGNSRQNPIEMAKSNSWFQFYTPDKTIDGQGMTYPDSRWQSDETMPTDIIFDLGKNQSFDSLRISYYKWETGKMFQFSVYTSRDSVNWFPTVEEIWSENSEWTELNVDSVETRYMKLLLVKSNQGPFASIWEVEMYGTENNSSGEEITSVPNSFDLSQNFPNPFNPVTNIKYSVPQPSQIQIIVYDILGNEIETLIDEYKQIGNYEVEFSAVNFPSGVYFYQLKTETIVETKKMILMK